MRKVIRLVLCIASSTLLPVLADEIELPQGSSISVEILQQLNNAHELAMNQKAQEDLYISLPLSVSNQSESVTVANTSAIASPAQNRRRKASKKLSNSALEPRANECQGDVWVEGQDPCEGLEHDPRFVPCYKPCMFTRDWFVDNAARKPSSSQCLFYTSGLSETARKFADRHNGQFSNQMKTIWHIWDRDPWMRYADRDIDNPMRCIIQSDLIAGARNTIRQRYFEGMSDAMAYMCGGRASVMDRNLRRGRTGKIKQAGIWGQVEFPRLKMEAANKYQGRVCNQIDAIGEQSSRDTNIWWKNWWVRGGPDWPSRDQPFKRASPEKDESVQDSMALNVTKRDYVPWDTSVFDEGGKAAIDW